MRPIVRSHKALLQKAELGGMGDNVRVKVRLTLWVMFRVMVRVVDMMRVIVMVKARVRFAFCRLGFSFTGCMHAASVSM